MALLAACSPDAPITAPADSPPSATGASPTESTPAAPPPTSGTTETITVDGGSSGDGVAVASVPFVDWLRDRSERDLIQMLGGDATEARLVISAGEERYDAGMLIGDELFPLPDPQFRVYPNPSTLPTVVEIGARVAVAGSWDDGREPAAELWLFDPTTASWEAGPALVDGANPLYTMASLAQSDDGIVAIARVLAIDGIRPASNRTVRIADDLSISELDAPPADADARFDTVVGERAFLFRQFRPDREPVGRSWTFDTNSGTWSALENPPWLPCAADDTCDWSNWDDEQVLIEIDGGVIVEVVPGDLAVLDASSLTWTDLVEPPFGLGRHDLVDTGAGYVVAMPIEDGIDDAAVPATAGLLDLDGLTWSTIEVEIDPAFATWTRVVTDDAVLLGDHTPAPTTVFDLATLDFREPTAAEREIWLARVTGWAYAFRPHDLADAFAG